MPLPDILMRSAEHTDALWYACNSVSVHDADGTYSAQRDRRQPMASFDMSRPLEHDAGKIALLERSRTTRDQPPCWPFKAAESQ